MSYATADLYDEYGEDLKVTDPIFHDYGGRKIFHGPVSTIKVFEDNSLVRTALEQPGDGQVLAVDGGGSLRCALLGDMLAQLARENNWSGIIIYGCIRDSALIARIDIGVKALATNPRKSVKKGKGERNVPITFAGATFEPGDFVYADSDGIVISTVKIIT